MGFFKQGSKSKLSNKLKESGNVFLMLFGAVGMVGVIGASTMTVMKGPVKTMSQVTKRTIAENNMIATGKLSLIAASSIQANDGDCDTDLTIEPVPYGTAISGFTGGGEVPSTIGTSKEDPWGMPYAYCVWDHGTSVDAGGCTGDNRLAGGDVTSEYVLAIISAGPDGVWDTVCNAFVDVDTNNIPDIPLVVKTSGKDDLVLGYTYNEASALAGGVWNIKSGDPNVAEISKDLEVTDSSNTVQLAFDSTAGDLTIGNAGNIPSINTDFLSPLNNAVIDFLSPVTSSDNITTTGDVGTADLTASGNATVTGTLGVTGATSLSTLGTSGLATLNSAAVTNNATVGGTLGVTGATSLSTLGTSGLATLNSAAVTNNATVGGTLGVTGATSLSTLGTSGLATLDSAAVTNNATVGGTLGVTGNTSLSTLSTSGLGTLDSLTVTNNASVGGTLDMTTGQINNLANPTGAQDAATKSYVDAAVISGGGDDLGNHTATQNLDLATFKIINLADPTNADEAATKSYVDAAVVAGADDLGNHIATQNLNMNTVNKIINLANPTLAQDAATKAYVDAAIAGGASGDELIDADGDTLVQVEETADDDTIRFDTAGTERMVISATGEVGIGTTTPVTKLDVINTGTPIRGANELDDNSSAGLLGLIRKRSSATAPGAGFGGEIRLNSEGFTNDDTFGAATIGFLLENNQTNDTTDRDASLTFDTMSNNSLTEKMRITSDGNVGIGTTSPGNALEVHDSAVAIGAIRNHTIDGNTPAASLNVVRTYDGGTGADGIGARIRFSVETETDGTTDIVGLIDAVATDATAGTVDGDIYLKPYLDGSIVGNAFVVKSTGSVGIGDIAPDGTLLLDVEGQVGATEYCDENGANCVAAGSLGSGVSGLDDLDDANVDTDTNWFVGHEGGTYGANNLNNFAIGKGALDSLDNAGSTSFLGDNNFAVGTNALTDLTTGERNTAVGIGALANATTGTYNVAVGNNAQSSILTGQYNVSLGTQTLQNNTANFNTAIGHDVLRYNTTGSANTAMGHYSMLYNRTGSQNVSIGRRAGFGVTTASDISNNTIMGYHAGYNMLTGADDNILIGHTSAATLTTGANNIIIGKGADVSVAAASNELNIGDIFFGSGVGTTAGSKVGAVEYCDENLANCFTAASAGGDNLGNHTATQALAMATFKITGMGDPTAAQDAATKAYVDANDADTLAALSCSSNQIAKWNGSAWACAADNDSGGGGGGTEITLMDPFAQDTQATVAHGLGSKPASVVYYLENKSSQFGYSVGDRVHLTEKHKFSLFSDNTNVGVSTGARPEIVYKNSNSNGLITPGNWKLVAVIGGAPLSDTLTNLSCTDGQVAEWDNTGSAWVCATPSGGATDEIVDADADTRIQVEESADEDTIRFDTAGTERAVITATGLVGIGTGGSSSPTHALTVDGGTNTTPENNSIMIKRNWAGGNSGPLLYFQKTRNEGQSLDGDNLGSIIGAGTDNTNTQANAARIEFQAVGDTTTTSYASQIAFGTTATGQTSITERMVIDPDGNVGIGTTTPEDLLHINSSTASPSITIEDSDAGPQKWKLSLNSTTGRFNFVDVTGGNTPFKVGAGSIESLLRVGVLDTETVDLAGKLVVGYGATNDDYESLLIKHDANSGGGLFFQEDGSDKFVGFSGFEGADNVKRLFVGGTDWGAHDANEMRFYTDPVAPTVANGGGIERFRISQNGNVGVGNWGGLSDTVDSALHLQSGEIRLDGGAGNQAGCFRFDDTTDKLQFSHDCSAYSDVGTGGSSLWTDNTTHITRENFHVLDTGLAAGSTTAGLDGDGTYSFYDPDKGALRGGRITGGNDAWQDANIGQDSFAWGANAEASGLVSAAIGLAATASNTGSVAFGLTAIASGSASIAVGSGNVASGAYSAAFGNTSVASGESSTAIGAAALASGTSSLSMGAATRSSGYGATSFGTKVRTGNGTAQTTDANSGVGNYSMAFGLGDASTVTYPQVTGNESAAFFFGDQQGEDITATNVLALEGGSLLLSNDSGTACAAAKKGALRLNATADGLEMCNGAGLWNATGDTLSGLSCADGQVAKWNTGSTAWICANDTGGGAGDDLGNHTATTALNMATTNKIINLADPTAAQDAATKTYVDTTAAAAADNLGDHEADQDLDLNTFKLVGNNGTEGISISAAGLVGIGTTAPASELHVSGSSATRTAIRIDNLDQTAGALSELAMVGTGTDAVSNGTAKLVGGKEQSWTSVATTRDAYMAIHTRQDNAMAEKMRITSAGLVGIGTNAPAVKLHVSGTGTVQTRVESTDNGAVQMRLKSDSTNRRLVAIDSADNTESQIVLEDNGQITFAGPTVASDTNFTILSNGIIRYAGITGAAAPTK